MKYVRLLAVLFVAVVLSGCAAVPFVVSGSHFIPRTSGDAVNFAYAKTITPGTATKADVEKGMGKPSFTSTENGAEKWKYTYHKDGNNLKTIVSHTVQVGDSTTVIVVFRGNVVVAVGGAEFIEEGERKGEDKFAQGDASLIPPFYQGKEMLMAMQPQSAASQQPAQVVPAAAPQAPADTAATSAPAKGKPAAKKTAPPKQI